MMKNHFYSYIGQNLIFCGLKKIMMPSESSWNFFIKGLRLVKPSIPESFSSAADGQRKRGRFLVELPNYSSMSIIVYEYIG